MRRQRRDFVSFVELARELRQRQTAAEEVMWELLRDSRFLGLKFRRQAPLGHFVADFFCTRLRLVVEVDGGIHATEAQAARDDNRDAYFEAQGYTVLRFRNGELLDHPETVLRQLEAAVHR